MKAEILPFAKHQDVADRRVADILQANVAMLATMFSALTEIINMTPSLDGGVAMKGIAEDAFIQVQLLADGDPGAMAQAARYYEIRDLAKGGNDES